MALGDQTFCGKLTLVGVAEVREYFNTEGFNRCEISDLCVRRIAQCLPCVGK
jgi:hypothetical protein